MLNNIIKIKIWTFVFLLNFRKLNMMSYHVVFQTLVFFVSVWDKLPQLLQLWLQHLKLLLWLSMQLLSETFHFCHFHFCHGFHQNSSKLWCPRFFHLWCRVQSIYKKKVTLTIGFDCVFMSLSVYSIVCTKKCVDVWGRGTCM